LYRSKVVRPNDDNAEKKTTTNKNENYTMMSITAKTKESGREIRGREMKTNRSRKK
jgi:hypothetical protein